MARVKRNEIEMERKNNAKEEKYYKFCKIGMMQSKQKLKINDKNHVI